MNQRLEVQTNGWKASTCVERIKSSKSPKVAEFLELIEFVAFKGSKVSKLLVEKQDDLYPKQSIQRLKNELEACGGNSAELSDKILRLSLAGEEISRAAHRAIFNESHGAWEAARKAAELSLDIIKFERAIDSENERTLFGAVGLGVSATELTNRWDRHAEPIRNELNSFDNAAAEATRRIPIPNPGARIINTIGF